MQRVVYCRRCDKRTAHAEDRSWAARWQCTTCKLRSFDDELEVAHGLHLLRSRKDEGGTGLTDAELFWAPPRAT